MIRLVSNRFHAETFAFVSQNKIICWSVYLISIIFFFIHVFVTTKRFLQHDTQPIVTTFLNDSLPMPIVKLQLDSLRKNFGQKNFGQENSLRKNLIEKNSKNS